MVLNTSFAHGELAMSPLMTPEQLDEARADEAWRITPAEREFVKNAMITAARLAREGWTPTDPDLIEAREIASLVRGNNADSIRAGNWDASGTMRIALAAIKRGRELAGQS
jgi:hypothetical protein